MEDDFDEGAMFSQEAIARPVSGNPLSRYFRQPGLAVRLPSGGAFNLPGEIEFNLDGTLSVKPMGAADELLLSSPDALMSGLAIEEAIKSCVPGVRNPRSLMAPDIEVLMLAIRAASFGEDMEIEPTCPECGREHAFDVSLPAMLASCVSLPSKIPVTLAPGLVAYLRPINMEQSTRLALITFDETRKAQALEAKPDTTEDDRRALMNAMLKKVMAINTVIEAECVVRIEMDGEVIVDRQHIREFIMNAPAPMLTPIDDKLKEINSLGLDTSVEMKCDGCGNVWKSGVELNQANFFVRGS